MSEAEGAAGTEPIEYKLGMLVKHLRKPEWGLGKVLHVGAGFVTVYFSRLPAQTHGEAIKDIGTSSCLLTRAPEQTHPWLDELPTIDEIWKLDKKSRLTQDQAIAAFVRKYPAGFADANYVKDEREWKWQAHEVFVELFGGGKGEELLAKDALEELVKHAEHAKLGLLLSPFENMAFHDALKHGESARRFLQALFHVVAAPGPDPAVFDRYISAVIDLPAQPGKARVATWPVMTILPFIARPDCYMFFKPEVTREAADRLGFNLHYTPTLNWPTYANLLRMSTLLLGDLRALGARDFMDVQSFIWVTGSYL